MSADPTLHDKLVAITDEDVRVLVEKDKDYGSSWKKRGGSGAFFMLARKWDRLENQVQQHNFDIFAAINKDRREEGILDDIRDLRRYLELVESEVVAVGKLNNHEDKTGQEHPFGYDSILDTPVGDRE